MSETKPGAGRSEAQLMDWPDSGGVAIVTWVSADGHLYHQELASRPDAEELLAKINAANELSLVSTQVRRVGIGPDS